MPRRASANQSTQAVWEISMAAPKIKFARTSDKRLVEILMKLYEEYGSGNCQISTQGGISLGAVNLEAPNQALKKLLGFDSHLIDSLSVQIPGLNLTYERGGSGAPETKSSIYDELSVQFREETPRSTEERLDVMHFLDRQFRPFQLGREPGPGLSPEQATMEALHNSMLERLEQLNAELARTTLETHERLEARYSTRVADQDARFGERLSALEGEFSARNEDLSTRSRDFDERVSQFDDRNNTHARREIRDRMLDDVKRRIDAFGVSAATEQKRGPVLVGILSLMFVFLCLISWTGFEIAQISNLQTTHAESLNKLVSLTAGEGLTTAAELDSLNKSVAKEFDASFTLWLWIRFSLLSAGLVASIIYYIRWRNSWAAHHANSEFQLQQFYIDVNRANWIIESCLEWRKETGSIIPTLLVKSITRNLFASSGGEPDQVIHPADQLASALMGSASKLKLRIGDSELDFDKPSKLRRTDVKTSQKPTQTD